MGNEIQNPVADDSNPNDYRARAITLDEVIELPVDVEKICSSAKVLSTLQENSLDE
jgi:hypothetical protein